MGLALLMALDPVRLGVILLIISRPRPVSNLLAYWVGCLLVAFPSLLVPLILVHGTSLVAPTTAASSNVRHFQLCMGILTLAIAALMTVRFSTRRRAQVATSAGNGSTMVLESDTDSDTESEIPLLAGRSQDATTESKSVIRRLLQRIRNAWENGSVWVALVIGIGSGPPAPLVLLILTTIVTSGAALGIQVSAATIFVVGMLAGVEVILVSYLASPAKTQAVLRLLHDWARPHRRIILVAIVAVVGGLLVANGMGSI